ncbi:MAG TPA: hypothetical protein VJQ83_06780, partial [Tepidiformaceae bacterium]|nr:hypothetical protein [Tepidiformaceae bacterium]
MDEVHSGQRIYLHGGAAAPVRLIDALAERALALRDIELVHMHSEGPAPYVAPEMAGHIRHNALFIGPNVREAVGEGRADYTPVFLSDIPALFRAGGPLPLDIALIHVTPPDAEGFCSLGVSVDCAPAAIHSAAVVIAQVNERMPRTRGVRIHQSEIDFAITGNTQLPVVDPAPLTDEARAIGRVVAGLVADGATLQLGIGAIPGAVLAELGSHQHLGVHTEMFTGELIPLIEAGVVDGSRKNLDAG